MNLPSVLEGRTYLRTSLVATVREFLFDTCVAVPSNTAGTAAGPARIIQSSLPFGRCFLMVQSLPRLGSGADGTHQIP